jgi:hypothetical protein
MYIECSLTVSSHFASWLNACRPNASMSNDKAMVMATNHCFGQMPVGQIVFDEKTWNLIFYDNTYNNITYNDFTFNDFTYNYFAYYDNTYNT